MHYSDFIHYQLEAPASTESPASNDTASEAAVADPQPLSFKERVFKIMDSLEGWCTHQKASYLIDIIFLLKPKLVVEVGVFGGKSLIPMALALKSNEKGKIIGIDPWDKSASVKGLDKVNRSWWAQVDHELIYNGFVNKVVELELENQIKILRKRSADIHNIRSIDILHLDANHSAYSLLFDVQKWVPHVRKNGLIIVGDVNWSTCAKAVEWLNKNCIKLIEVNEDNVWAVWIKN